MESLPKESCIILTLKGLQKDAQLSVRKAARIYKIPETSLRHRRAGKQLRYEIATNLQKLTNLEEKVLLKRVLDLNIQGF
jgi:hypothetical protein